MTKTDEERFKDLWKRGGVEGEVFTRYDINFLLHIVNELRKKEEDRERYFQEIIVEPARRLADTLIEHDKINGGSNV